MAASSIGGSNVTPRKLFSARGMALRAAGIFVAVLAAGLFYNSRRLESRIAALFENGGSAEISIAQATDFSWEQLRVFGPYTPLDEINRCLGFRWPDAASTSIQNSDEIALLVFVEKRKVVAHVEQSRKPADFASVASCAAFSPATAKFRAERDGDRFRVKETESPPPPDGAMIVQGRGPQPLPECAVVPCRSGACRVSCPSPEEQLSIDIHGGLTGHIVISVDGVTVLDENIPVVTTTGLTVRVGVWPREWPTQVDVRVNELRGSINVEPPARFLGTSPSSDGRELRFHPQIDPYYYD